MKFFKFKSFATRISFFTTIIAFIICTIIVMVVYWSQHDRRINDAVLYTHSLLDNMALKADNQLSIIETILKSSKWKIENNISNPEQLTNVIKDIVINNEEIIGGSIAFEPYQYKDKGLFFMIYVKSTSPAQAIVKTFVDSSYNYFNMDWYSGTKHSKQPYWSEPYFDQNAGNEVMCTYAIPLYDKSEKLYAVVSVDMSLAKLSSMMDNLEPIPDSYSFMLSRSGRYITHANKKKILTKTIFDNAKCFENKDYELVGENMVKGITGTTRFYNDGVDSYAFYTSLPNVGWSICNVCPTDVILKDVNNIITKISAVLLVVLIILYISIYNAVKRISRPLEDFSASASEISKGNFNAKLPAIKTSDEMLTLHASFENMQLSLTDYIAKLTDETQKRQRIDSELQIARNIQQGMLPQNFSSSNNRDEIDLAASLIAAKEVGGDLYNFFIHDDIFYFIIGDVSGKGIPASLIMAITCSLFTALSLNNSPKKTISLLNDTICKGNETNMFVTAITGTLNLKSGKLTVCNAGHNPAVLINNSNNPELLSVTHNLPIGLIPNFSYVEDEFMLNDNTSLVLYTDGITEAENIKSELYGTDRLVSVLTKCNADTADVILNKVLKHVASFVDNAPQSDDIALIVLKYKPVALKNQTEAITLSNNLNEISKIQKFVSEISIKADISEPIAMKLNLVLEEVVSNIIMYAYPKDKLNYIHIHSTFDNSQDTLTFVISDKGIPFNPIEVNNVDITAGLEDRKVGGLGIFIVKKLMDDVSYQRISDTNILTLTKKLNTK